MLITANRLRSNAGSFWQRWTTGFRWNWVPFLYFRTSRVCSPSGLFANVTRKWDVSTWIQIKGARRRTEVKFPLRQNINLKVNFDGHFLSFLIWFPSTVKKMNASSQLKIGNLAKLVLCELGNFCDTLWWTSFFHYSSTLKFASHKENTQVLIIRFSSRDPSPPSSYFHFFQFN